MLERLKELRKMLNLTQAELSLSLDYAKAYIGQIECGVKPLSDRTIRDICRMYNVNEEWLREGNGEPFIPRTKNEEIADFLNSIMEDEPDSIRRIFIETFSKLPYEAWEVLDQLAENYVKNKKDR